MTRRALDLTSVAVGIFAAGLLPVLPWRDEIRSFMVGGGGDQVSHEWSLTWLPAIIERARRVSPPATQVLLDVLVFVALATAVTLGLRRLNARS